MKKQDENDITEIRINPIKTKTLKVKVGPLDGSTYIPHRLAPENVERFMARETGKSKQKELRDYDAEYESCFYYTKDKKYGIPARCFMAALLGAAMEADITKAQLKRVVRVVGDVYTLEYERLERRIDNPRRGGINKTPDTRHRPEFFGWSCDILIQYVADKISPDQIVNLLNLAGFSCGVGEWRPSSPKSSGTHGMFRVLGT